MTVTDTRVSELFTRRQGDRSTTVARMRSLLGALGDPQTRFAAVHVTATNGKTTTARMIDALLREHGVRTGAYLSPHLQDVRERVCVDGELIGEAELMAGLDLVEAHRIGLGEPDRALSFFETMTGVAFAHFAHAGVDTAVVEVGRGGRNDATNVLNAPVAVIGPVALDHPDLGSTVAEIAADKAGIIAPGASVVVGPQEDSAAAVIAAAADARGALLLRHGVDFAVRDWRPTTGGQSFTAELPGGSRVAVELPLIGRHQADNAILALVAARQRLGELDEAAARRCLSGFRAPGRCEIVRRPGHATVWLDGAHNPAAAAALATALTDVPQAARVILVAAFMSDKDADGILAELAPVTHRAVLAPAPSRRGGDPSTWHAHGLRPHLAATAVEALDMADQLARPQDVVLVTGSLYTVGAVRASLGL